MFKTTLGLILFFVLDIVGLFWIFSIFWFESWIIEKNSKRYKSKSAIEILLIEDKTLFWRELFKPSYPNNEMYMKKVWIMRLTTVLLIILMICWMYLAIKGYI